MRLWQSGSILFNNFDIITGPLSASLWKKTLPCLTSNTPAVMLFIGWWEKSNMTRENSLLTDAELMDYTGYPQPSKQQEIVERGHFWYIPDRQVNPMIIWTYTTIYWTDSTPCRSVQKIKSISELFIWRNRAIASSLPAYQKLECVTNTNPRRGRQWRWDQPPSPCQRYTNETRKTM